MSGRLPCKTQNHCDLHADLPFYPPKCVRQNSLWRKHDEAKADCWDWEYLLGTIPKWCCCQCCQACNSHRDMWHFTRRFTCARTADGAAAPVTWNACAGRRSKSIEWQFRGSRGSALNHFFWCKCLLCHRVSSCFLQSHRQTSRHHQETQLPSAFAVVICR